MSQYDSKIVKAIKNVQQVYVMKFKDNPYDILSLSLSLSLSLFLSLLTQLTL